MKLLKAKSGSTIDELRQYIDSLGIGLFTQAGYEQDQGGIIGKKNGISNVDAMRTKTWDEAKTAPDGTEYILSLSNDPKYIDWKQFWLNAGFSDIYEEYDRPDSYNTAQDAP